MMELIFLLFNRKRIILEKSVECRNSKEWFNNVLGGIYGGSSVIF